MKVTSLLSPEIEVWVPSMRMRSGVVAELW